MLCRQFVCVAKLFGNMLPSPIPRNGRLTREGATSLTCHAHCVIFPASRMRWNGTSRSTTANCHLYKSRKRLLDHECDSIGRVMTSSSGLSFSTFGQLAGDTAA